MEALGVSLPGLIAQIINFVLLLIILRAVAYKPILRMLDERATRIRESMERADEMKRQATRAEEEFARQIAEARREGQDIIAQAQKISERVREEEVARTRTELEEMRARAVADIARERDVAMAQLRRQVADLAVLAAGRAVGRALDESSHRRLIEEAANEAQKVEIR